RHLCPVDRRRRRQWRLAGSGTATMGSGGLGLGVGGSGTLGGTAGNVVVDSYSVSSNGAFVAQAPPGTTATIWASGKNCSGIFAQSVGGGGGNGGFAATLGFADLGTGLGVTVGGQGGPGADAGTVTVLSYNNILTPGANSFGILAQSIGGGGGNGGLAVARRGGAEWAGAGAGGGFGRHAGGGDRARWATSGS